MADGTNLGYIECDTCNGTGKVSEPCPTCKGSTLRNLLNNGYEPCPTCHGTGHIPQPDPRQAVDQYMTDLIPKLEELGMPPSDNESKKNTE